MTDLLIRDVEIDGRPGLDVRVSGGRITEIGVGIRGPGDSVDGRGGALIAGLHDHHIHLYAWAARARSIDVGQASRDGPAAFADALRARAAELAPGAWLRALGFDEAVAGLPDRAILDAIVADRPVRVQDRTGALWVLNSAALEKARIGDDDRAGSGEIERGPDGTPNGRIWRGDTWLRSRLDDDRPSLAQIGGELARFGVTGVTDAGVTTDDAQAAAFAAAIDRGEFGQRLTLMSGGALRPDPAGRFAVGPVKLVLDERALPDFDAALSVLTLARSWNRPIAAHCVTAGELAFFLALLGDGRAGPGDRVEHGGVIIPEAAAVIADLGLTVVTQPAFVTAKGDRYLAEVDAADQPWLYPCGSLLAAGIGVAASSDAPYGPADPWTAIAAASTRRTASGRVLGGGERIAAARALALFQGEADHPGGPPRRLAVGAPADLCLLHVPVEKALADPTSDHVRATIVAGVVIPR